MKVGHPRPLPRLYASERGSLRHIRVYRSCQCVPELELFDPSQLERYLRY